MSAMVVHCHDDGCYWHIMFVSRSTHDWGSAHVCFTFPWWRKGDQYWLVVAHAKHRMHDCKQAGQVHRSLVWQNTMSVVSFTAGILLRDTCSNMHQVCKVVCRSAYAMMTNFRLLTASKPGKSKSAGDIWSLCQPGIKQSWQLLQDSSEYMRSVFA